MLTLVAPPGWYSYFWPSTSITSLPMPASSTGVSKVKSTSGMLPLRKNICLIRSAPCSCASMPAEPLTAPGPVFHCQLRPLASISLPTVWL